MQPLSRPSWAALLFSALAACSSETRPVGAALPQTPPTGEDDPRIVQYEGNAYQVSQGGRYYLWYACAGCHASNAGPGRDLASGRSDRSTGFAAIYRSIATGHANVPGASGDRIPADQLWQMTAYVRSLPTLDPQKRRRQDIDLFAEPRGKHGPAPQ